MNDEQRSYEDILNLKDDAPEFKPASTEVEQAIADALEGVKARPVSGRYAQFGRMINCKVCGTRHRERDFTYREKFEETPAKTIIKSVELTRVRPTCEQKFKYLHTEEDLETGEVTDIFAEAARTRNGVIGAAQFKGKRHHPHYSAVKLQLIEIVRSIFEGDPNPESEGYKERMLLARSAAVKILKARHRKVSRRKRKFQNISRRINRGLFLSKSQKEGNTWHANQTQYRKDHSQSATS